MTGLDNSQPLTDEKVLEAGEEHPHPPVPADEQPDVDEDGLADAPHAE